MAIYAIGRRSTNVTSGQVSMDVAVSTGPRVRVMEWSVCLAAATASIYGLNRTTANGTRTTPTALLAEDEREPVPTGIALIDSAIAHSVQPTLATDYLRRIALPATIGTGWIWTFPEGIVLQASATVGSLCLVNLATNGVVDSSVVVRQ